MSGQRGSRWRDYYLTSLGELAAATGYPVVLMPCLGPRCLAMTPNGRRCHFCRRTMRLELERAPFRLATLPVLADTSPIAREVTDEG